VPANSSGGNLPISVTINGVPSQANVVLPVAGPVAPITLSGGNDISSAVAFPIGPPVQLTADRVTKPHVVYAVTLVADQLFSVQMTWVPPFVSGGLDVSARLTLYAGNIQTVQINNPILAYMEVGSFLTTNVLNYRVAQAGTYYLDFFALAPSVSLSATASVKALTPSQPSGTDVSSGVPVSTGWGFRRSSGTLA
jgi:hypothetical protein